MSAVPQATLSLPVASFVIIKEFASILNDRYPYSVHDAFHTIYIDIGLGRARDVPAPDKHVHM